MTERFHTLSARGIDVTVDLAVGHLRSVVIERAGRRVTPLYTAPWVDDPAIAGDESIPPNLRFLSGDFFCAPFALSDVDPAPTHGWPANSEWQHIATDQIASGGTRARFALRKRVIGAQLTKEITLRNDHPFIYQRHIFEGGNGAIPVASHAMTWFATRGRLSFSPKISVDVPERPLEPDPKRGRCALAYPARFTDLGKAPLKAGGTTDLRSYPIADRHEDFVMLVEAPASDLGWAAALREEPGDIVLSLKHPADLPVTLLWFSNGGRDYPPWDGRNVGVLGIEEARSYSLYGHAASVASNPLAESGVPTALELDPTSTVEVRHVVGALPLPAGWTEIASVEAERDALWLADISGRQETIPFDSAFLARRG